MSSKCAKIKGVRHVNISLNNRTYQNNQQELIENLCEEIFLSFNFQKWHTALNFLHSRSAPELTVNELPGRPTISSLTAPNLLVPWCWQA